MRSLRHVYQLDDNYLVPRGLSGGEPEADLLISGYTLRSREDDIPDLRPAETWVTLEGQLRLALQAAADQLLKLGRIGAAAHQKYFLSVTEQEIIHGLPGYGRDTDEGTRQTPAAEGSQAIALIRDHVGGSGAPARPVRDPFGLFRRLASDSRLCRELAAGIIEADPRLALLKASIKRVLPSDSIVTAQATLDERGVPDGAYLEGFASAIQRKLEEAVDRHIAQVSAIEEAPDFGLQRERAEHRVFGEQKRKIFIGRENNLAAIDQYLVDRTGRPLVLHGRSGFGKSALMARAVANAETAGSAPVIYRFVGATAPSSDIRSLLISLVEDLAAHGIAQKPDEFEEEANRFVDQVKELLSTITKPVVMFLDAIDQLAKPYRPGWLPDQLPTGVKIVVSVLNDEDYATDSGIYRRLRQRLPAGSFLEIEPLGASQGLSILSALEEQSRRRLQGSQRAYIIRQFEKAGASPLYLRTAFEIANNWRSTDTAGEGHCMLADETAALIAQFINDLSAVHHHAPELVTCTLGYLTAAKDGLSAKELTEVLSRNREVMEAISSEKFGARTQTLPPSVWVRLNRHLAPFLVERRVDDQPLLQFFHRQVAHVARETHYEASKTNLHGALAAYFDSQDANPDRQTRTSEEAGRSVYTKRCLSELPYQLHHARNSPRLDDVLLSPDWMRQKLAAFGPQALTADYEQFGRSSMQTLVGRTLRLSTGICARDPRQLLPQLIGRLFSCAEPAAPDFLSRARRFLERPVLLPQFSSLTPPGAETARLEGHTGEVKAIAVLANGQLASGGADKAIRLWDVATGAETARLDGHTGEIKAMAVLPDGRLASAAADTTIRLWNIAAGEETAQLAGHKMPVIALAILADGRLASGSDDRTVRLWDVKSGVEVACLAGHGDSVNALAALADGRLISGSSDRTIRLWNVQAGVETARLERGGGEAMELALGGLPIGGVLALAVLPNGRLASGWDSLIRQWNLVTCKETASPMSHPHLVRALAVFPDGRLAAGCDDGTIRLWDMKTEIETSCLAGHGSSINGLAVLADGRLASISDDRTVRLWDVAAGVPNVGVAGDGNSVNALAVCPEGCLVSGSGSHWGGTIRLWDINNGTEISQLKSSGSGINAFAVLPDGRVASCSGGRIIELWDLKRGVSTGNHLFHDDGVNALSALPDGRLASGSRDRTIRLWDVDHGTELARFPGDGSAIITLAMLHDGRLASGSDEGTIQFWDVNTGAETARLKTLGGSILALEMLSDGRLASGSRDGSIRLWDVNAASEDTRLKGHTNSIAALAALPDGRLASGSYDRTIRLWDPSTDVETTRLEIDAPVSSVIALPGGRLVTGDRLGRLHWLKIED